MIHYILQGKIVTTIQCVYSAHYTVFQEKIKQVHVIQSSTFNHNRQHFVFKATTMTYFLII